MGCHSCRKSPGNFSSHRSGNLNPLEHTLTQEIAMIFAYRSTVILLAIVATVSRGQADEGGSLKDAAAALAKKVREVAGGLKPPQVAVRIGRFTPHGVADDLGVNGGGFESELATALGGLANRDALLEVSGEVRFLSDPARPDLKEIRIKAKLQYTNGDEVGEFKEFVGTVRKVTDIARFTGASVSFKPDSEYKDSPPSSGRNKDLQKTLPPGPGRPPEVQAAIEGTFVRTRKESPYAVEIRKKSLDAPGGALPVTASLVEGLPFVGIERGEVYEVRVVNDSNQEIAVSLAIDGIDQFTFSEDRKPDGTPKFSHWIVGPAKDKKPGEVLIVGWHKTADPSRKDNVLSFLVTEYGKGTSVKFPTRAQGKIGTITVGISRSYVPGPNAPRSASETGFGPPREVKQEVVKRQIDDPHEFITVRYTR